jgi:hypothetical protein
VEVLEQKAETKKALNEVEVVKKEWNNCSFSAGTAKS